MPTRGRIDAAPHAADLLATLGQSPQVLRDAQTEICLFGPDYHACAAVAAAIDAVSDFITAPIDVDMLAITAADARSLDRSAV